MLSASSAASSYRYNSFSATGSNREFSRLVDHKTRMLGYEVLPFAQPSLAASLLSRPAFVGLRTRSVASLLGALALVVVRFDPPGGGRIPRLLAGEARSGATWYEENSFRKNTSTRVTELDTAERGTPVGAGAVRHPGRLAPGSSRRLARSRAGGRRCRPSTRAWRRTPHAPTRSLAPDQPQQPVGLSRAGQRHVAVRAPGPAALGIAAGHRHHGRPPPPRRPGLFAREIRRIA